MKLRSIALLVAFSITGANIAVASTTYTIHAIAGYETGLVKFAALDDTIAIGGKDDVVVSFSGGPESRYSNWEPGLLYDCEGAFNRQNCDVYGTTVFYVPGTYTYTVTYESAGISGGTVDVSGTVIVEEPGSFVIVSVGDSVASGEGSPEKIRDEIIGRGYWDDISSNYRIDPPDDLGCHRSSFAGPALAAQRIAATNDVTFIHIACSGASFGPIQAGDYNQEEYPIGQLGKIDTQLYWLRERFERIDVMMLSGGANNINGGFGSVVTACLGFGSCAEDDVFVESLRRSILELPEHYDDFATLLNEGPGASRSDWAGLPDQIPNLDNLPEVVAITEYFDPTRNEDGVFPTDAESALCAGPTMKQSEWEFLYNEMVVPLNQEVMLAADRHGWVFVGGIANAFRTHGYCSSGGPGDVIGDAWVVKAPESLAWQGDKAGTAHPDSTGQSVYGDRLYMEIVEANPPRTSATATTAGQPYTFGTWVNTDVEVTLMAYNPIRESGVAGTYYASDEPLCTYESLYVGLCTPYTLPFVVTGSGRNTVSYFSENEYLAPEKYVESVEIWIDKDPPVMTCSATLEEIWPPNKKFTPVSVAVTSVDEVSGPAEYWLSAISDSYGQAKKAIIGFDLGEADTEGEMLADRRGNLGAREYKLTYSSADHVGNIGTCDVVVTVPKDQRRGRLPGS